MAQLRQDFDQFEGLDTKIIVVGPEDAKAFGRYWEEEKLPFIGIPDAKSGILKQFGQEVNLFKLGRMPAQVLVDKEGTARFVHYGHSMSDIPANEEVLETIRSL